MTQKVYKFEPGQCSCLLGDFGAGSQKTNVLKLSGTEMVIEATVPLKAEQFVYTTVKLTDGPSFALRGLVVTTAAGGILIQWMHSHPKDGDRIEAALAEYTKSRASAASTLPASPAPAGLAAAPAAGASPAAAAAPASPPAAARETATAAPAAPIAAAPVVTAATSELPKRSPAKARRRARAASGGPIQSVAPASSPVTNAPDEDALGVNAKLRKKSRTVRSADLASRVDTVQVVNMGIIRSLVQEAVDESLTLNASRISDAEKKHLLEEAEASFAERLALFKAEKSGLEVQIHTLQGSLQKAQGLLEEERGKILSANQFTVSDAGMVELEHRLGRILDHAVKAGNAGKDLEEDLRAVVVKLLDDERQKIREQAQQAQSDRIQLLERKVQRLASSLESAESERNLAQERALALEASGGMPLRNVMKAGLDASDPARNRKLGLLNEIFKFNQEIRERLVAEGRIPERKSSALATEPAREAGADLESAPAEEARIARDLGITRSDPPGQEARAPVQEQESENKKEEELSALPVLASGSEVDPDDMPWEPPASAAPDQERVTIKRLGSGR